MNLDEEKKMTDLQTERELALCPFCGTKPVLFHWHAKWSGEMYEVECRNVECPMFDCHDSEDAAIDAWNTRSE